MSKLWGFQMSNYKCSLIWIQDCNEPKEALSLSFSPKAAVRDSDAGGQRLKRYFKGQRYSE